MKNFFLLLLLATAISFSFTQDSSRKIEWISDTEYDFGVLIHKQPGVHSFKFKNVSNEPLTIDNVRTTCGCTSPDWSADVVMPDSIGVIKLEYDAYKLGYFHKLAKVFINGQKKSEKLVIEGEVVEE